jgi:hypothetical protein
MRPYLKKPFTKIGLVEWLKVKALSSNPSTAKKKRMLIILFLPISAMIPLKVSSCQDFHHQT